MPSIITKGVCNSGNMVAIITKSDYEIINIVEIIKMVIIAW